MATYRLSSIIEIGILNSRMKKLRSKKDLQYLLKEAVTKTYSNLVTIGGFEVIHAYATDSTKYVEINDFDYSCINKCEKNKEYTVFRIFPKDDVIIIDTHLIELDTVEMFKVLDRQKYEMGKLLIELTCSSFKQFNPKKGILKLSD